MGCANCLCHLLLFLSALLTGFLSYYMYQVVPGNVERPWLVSAWLGARQFVQHVALIEEKMGIEDRLVISRQIYNAVDRYKMQNEAPDKTLKISTTLFGDIRVRIYEPKKRTKGPAVLYFHGGGWTIGTIDSVHTTCRELASRSGILVISVSFSLAPESPYPQALDDVENATRHLMDNGQRYGVHPDKIVLAGDGTGANLAAALTLRSRDRNWPHQPVLQVLLYPILQVFDFKTPSYAQNGQLLLPLNNPVNIAKNVLHYMRQNPNHARSLVVNNHTSKEDRLQYGGLISHELLADKFRAQYQASVKGEDVFDAKLASEVASFVLHPHFAPMMYGNGKLHRLAKAYIATMEHDSVRDDGLIYARRLRQSGAKAVLKHYENGYHDCLNLLGYTALADKVLNDLVDFLQRDVL